MIFTWLEEWKDSNEVEIQETLQLGKQITSKLSVLYYGLSLQIFFFFSYLIAQPYFPFLVSMLQFTSVQSLSRV